MTRTTPGLAPPFSKLPRHTNWKTFGHYVSFSVQQAPYTADLQWNRISNLEPFGSKAETLPLGHRGLNLSVKKDPVKASRMVVHLLWAFIVN
ncbi:hypothetical protein AVEN_195134-1 [Araneus ventricosus]|uniref:Uncharacterized protein n=1 Tax=Araneus ventricosus TaxID=182803 RepID=A0A4Y2BGS4_ARAVE|nr:hypothetical protein AVEN_195134-1 [Araneus ventricosus]